MAWEQLVNTFQDGDVLYGLDDGRKAAKQAILSAQAKTKIKVLFLGCIPRNKKVERIVIQNAVTDSVFDALTIGTALKTGGKFFSTDQQIRSNKGVKADPDRAVGFRDHLLAHRRWNLEKGISDEEVRGAGWKANKPDDAPVTDMDRARKAWTRTSKAGLEYQTKVRGATVHFILDGLDFNRVVQKHPGDVTSAEIRWLYRHRNDEAVMNNVKFWLDGEEQSEPPWKQQSNASIFAKYKPRHEDIAEDHSDSSNLREAIGTVDFHNLRTFWENKGK